MDIEMLRFKAMRATRFREFREIRQLRLFFAVFPLATGLVACDPASGQFGDAGAGNIFVSGQVLLEDGESPEGVVLRIGEAHAAGWDAEYENRQLTLDASGNFEVTGKNALGIEVRFHKRGYYEALYEFNQDKSDIGERVKKAAQGVPAAKPRVQAKDITVQLIKIRTPTFLDRVRGGLAESPGPEDSQLFFYTPPSSPIKRNTRVTNRCFISSGMVSAVTDKDNRSVVLEVDRDADGKILTVDLPVGNQPGYHTEAYPKRIRLIARGKDAGFIQASFDGLSPWLRPHPRLCMLKAPEQGYVSEISLDAVEIAELIDHVDVSWPRRYFYFYDGQYYGRVEVGQGGTKISEDLTRLEFPMYFQMQPDGTTNLEDIR